MSVWSEATGSMWLFAKLLNITTNILFTGREACTRKALQVVWSAQKKKDVVGYQLSTAQLLYFTCSPQDTSNKDNVISEGRREEQPSNAFTASHKQTDVQPVTEQ